MTDRHQNDERIESILRTCLERPEGEWSSAVETACETHPGLAAEIRHRVDALRAFGMVGEDLAAPSGQFGPFQLIRVLGSGATATVYLAEREGEETPVALKILRRDLLQSAVAVQRFQREVDLASRLDDPGICRVLSTGNIDGTPYIAMIHVSGTTLAQQIDAARKQGPPRTRADMERLVRIIEKVARTLHMAHDHGLVHRDIKPSNIMITETDDPVLMDLGLAADTEAGQSLTMSGTLLGTPIYMSPEVILAERKADVRSDVYSLGVSLFECLCLQPPWKTPTREALFQQVLHGSQPNLAARNREVDRDLALVVSTAMARDARQRYHSAQELADDLARWRSGETLSVRHPSLPRRAGRWVARNRMATAFLLVLVLGLTATTVLLDRSRAALTRASALALAHAAVEAQHRDPELSVLLARTAVERFRDPATVSELHAALADYHDFTEASPEQIQNDERFPDQFGKALPTARISESAGAGSDMGGHGTLHTDHNPVDSHQIMVFNGDGSYVTALTGHEGRVSHVSISPDQKWFLTASQDQTARIWDREGHELSRTPRHGCIVQAARFSPDFVPENGLILTAGGDGIARLFAATGHALTEFRGHGGFIRDVAITEDRKQIATWSQDDTARIWAVKSPVVRIMAGDGGHMISGAIDDAGRVVTLDSDGCVRLWNLEGESQDLPEGLADLANSHTLLTSGMPAIITFPPGSTAAAIWNLGGRLIGHFRPRRMPDVAAMRGTTLVTAAGSSISWWTLSGAAEWRCANTWTLPETITSLGLHPEEELVACGGQGGLVQVRGSDGTVHPTPDHDDRVWSISFSQDGNRLLTASRDNTARILDLRNGTASALEDHGSTVLSAAFSPVDDLIATSSVDRTVRLWDFTGKLVAILRGHAGQVRHVAFSLDGRRLLSCSADTTARIWLPRTDDLLRLAIKSVPRDFTAKERQRYAELLDW